MPVKRQSRAAQSRNALRALPARRFATARAVLQQRRLVRPHRLHDATAGKRNCRFRAGPRLDGENARDFFEAIAPALRAGAVRSLVCETL